MTPTYQLIVKLVRKRQLRPKF